MHGFLRTFRFQVKNALERSYVERGIHKFPGYTANLASPVKLGLRTFDVTFCLYSLKDGHARPCSPLWQYIVLSLSGEECLLV